MDWLEPLVDAVMVTLVDFNTTEELIVNWPVEEPAPIVTVAGTFALLSLDESETTTPPGPAGATSVTSAQAEFPPSTASALVTFEIGSRTLIDSVADCEVDPNVAETVALVEAVTVVVVI